MSKAISKDSMAAWISCFRVRWCETVGSSMLDVDVTNSDGTMEAFLRDVIRTGRLSLERA